MKFCYAYIDPRKPGKWESPIFCFMYEPIYIGIGSGNRHLDHLKRSDIHPLTSKIKSIRNEGLEPYIEKIAVDLNTNDAKMIECSIISFIGRKCLGTGPLLNITGGGEGNFDPPLEIRKKLASFGFRGKSHSVETKIKIGRSNSLHPTIKERGKALGIKNAGKKHSHETNLKKGRAVSLNSRAKVWMIENSNGEFEIVIGRIKQWCKENHVSYHTFSSKSKKFYCD